MEALSVTKGQVQYRRIDPAFRGYRRPPNTEVDRENDALCSQAGARFQEPSGVTVCDWH